MPTVVEDRVLARIALDAVAWNGSAHVAVLGDIAATPEVVRAVDEDIADIISNPDRLAQARACAPHRPDRFGRPGRRLAA